MGPEPRSITDGKTFRKFLEEGSLKYYSREEFNQEMTLDAQTGLTDEQSILSALLDDNDQFGLVLSGPGGVGKTRLALQLALEAEANGWLVLQVERNTSREAIEQLAREHTSSANVLLVIDYAEAAKSLFDLAQEMERANDERGHKFRFVATCRASALATVKEALDGKAYEVMEFSGEPDDHYADWVVGKILASNEISNAEYIAGVSAGIPVLAAFAVYLSQQFPADFQAQFDLIHGSVDFVDWVDKRLRLALQALGIEDHASRRRLAIMAASLPLSPDEYHALRALSDHTGRLLDLLLADRWIEFDSEGLAAAHDIFVDALAARYMFETSVTTTDRVGDILSDAMDAGAFDRALITLNRLAANQRYADIDGLAVIKRLHARNPERVIAAHEILIRTNIPDARTGILLLTEIPGMADAVKEDMSCDGPISHLAEVVAKSKSNEWRDASARVLEPFLDRAVKRPHGSNMIVRRALRLIPDRYRVDALARIGGEPARSETHYLIVAWLQVGLPIEDIITEIERWFINGGEADAKASFVFPAWLDAAARLGETECAAKIAMVEPYLLAWLEKYGTIEDAKFVYKSWLDSGGSADRIRGLWSIGYI